MEKLHLICPACGQEAENYEITEAMAGLTTIKCGCGCGQQWRLVIREAETLPQPVETIDGLTVADLVGDGWREMGMNRVLERISAGRDKIRLSRGLRVMRWFENADPFDFRLGPGVDLLVEKIEKDGINFRRRLGERSIGPKVKLLLLQFFSCDDRIAAILAENIETLRD